MAYALGSYRDGLMIRRVTFHFLAYSPVLGRFAWDTTGNFTPRCLRRSSGAPVLKVTYTHAFDLMISSLTCSSTVVHQSSGSYAVDTPSLNTELDDHKKERDQLPNVLCCIYYSCPDVMLQPFTATQAERTRLIHIRPIRGEESAQVGVLARLAS